MKQNQSKLRKNLFPKPALICLDSSSVKYGYEVDYWEEVNRETSDYEEYPYQHANTIAEESCKAAKQLGDIGDEKAVRSLIKLLNGEIGGHINKVISKEMGENLAEEVDDLVIDLVIKSVIVAAEALGKIGKKSAVKALKNIEDGTILGGWGNTTENIYVELELKDIEEFDRNEDVSKAVKLALEEIEKI